jgi:GH24 family phage-related lysozyme (muramidase)
MMLNRGEYDIGDEFLGWCKINGKISKGLLRRRIAEKELYYQGNH